MLVEQGHEVVVVFDNLRVGLRDNAIHPRIKFVEGSLLSQMYTTNVNNIIFASSGLVYGSPTRAKLGVTVPTAPETPFATANVTIESMLADLNEANGLSSVSLRFNTASGVAEQCHHYQWHEAPPPSWSSY